MLEIVAHRIQGAQSPKRTASYHFFDTHGGSQKHVKRYLASCLFSLVRGLVSSSLLAAGSRQKSRWDEVR